MLKHLRGRPFFRYSKANGKRLGFHIALRTENSQRSTITFLPRKTYDERSDESSIRVIVDGCVMNGG